MGNIKVQIDLNFSTNERIEVEDALRKIFGSHLFFQVESFPESICKKHRVELELMCPECIQEDF